MRIPLSAAITLALLSGCGEPEKEPETDPTPPDPIDYSQLMSTTPTREALVLADEATLDRHIKNGLRLAMASMYTGGGGGSAGGGSSSSGAPPEPSPAPVPGSPASPGSGGDEGSGGDVPFSDTNVHVTGVDESDFAKFDGTHWYVATSTAHSTDLTVSGSPGFQIVAPDPTVPTAEILSQYELDDESGSVGEMYLLEDGGSTSQVVLLRNRHGNVPPNLPMPAQAGVAGVPTSGPAPAPELAPVAASSASGSVAGAAIPGWFEPTNGKVRLQLIDVQDSYIPVEAWDIELDGTLIDSRKIGDVIYLVTRFEPWVQGLGYGGSDTAEHRENEETLIAQPLSELLPQFQVDGGPQQPLTTECYVQQDLPENSGFSSLVHVTAIDLRQQSLLSSRCLNTAISAISMSQESLYLTGNVVDPTTWRSEDTVIHKFSFDEESGLRYTASGFVNGSIHGRSDPAFRLHEHEGDLRVVTTRWTDGPEHQLFILRPAEQNLETVASLPNNNRPEPLGKPNEDIFSVRFEANRAFIVTFQRTDPLYAIDLSDPLDPKVAGELEIPGFATYMHPLNERYLFTLGREASDNGAVLGIKAELIDLSGGDPVSVNSVVFGGRQAQSEALHNLRALNFLQVDDGTWRVAFPYEQYAYEYSEDHQSDRLFYVNGLQLLEISGLDGGDAQLADAGFIEAENGESDYSSFFNRGLLQGDAAFYAHKNAIWAATWGATDEAVGPITAAPPVCDTNAVNGVQLTLELETAGEHNACEATVTINDGTYEEILEPLSSQSGDQSCTFVGAEERAGNYTLTAELPGFKSQNRYFTAWQDECHVITARQGMTLRDCAVISQAGLEVVVRIPGEAQCQDGTASVVQDGEARALEFIGSGGSSWSSSGNPQKVCFFGASYLGDYETLKVNFEGYQPHKEDGVPFTDSPCTSNIIQRRVDLIPL